DVADFE
ncbi:hypothetical protein VCHENC02_1751C, partial [Vibrio harveyi]